MVHKRSIKDYLQIIGFFKFLILVGFNENEIFEFYKKEIMIKWLIRSYLKIISLITRFLKIK